MNRSSNRLIRFIGKFGLLGSVIICTAISIAISVAITVTVILQVDAQFIDLGIVIAIVCPLLIAPPITYMILKLLFQLHDALNQVTTLTGLLPICSSCRKIRDDKGYWDSLEAYIEKNSDAEFTHGICPDCKEEHYGSYLHQEESK